MSSSSRALTLADALWPQAEQRNRVLRNAVLALVGTALLTLSAKVQVPFWPVPMTMQTFMVLVIGVAYGPRLGMATVLLYLAEGAVGLPVFAGAAAGPAYLAGPTAGYLLGFVLAAGLCGWAAERGMDRRFTPLVVVMVGAHLLILALGTTWLALGLNLGWAKAYAVGLHPFWAATVLKSALAVALLPAIWKLTKR
jgi:biotin transport system substrate-specific component